MPSVKIVYESQIRRVTLNEDITFQQFKDIIQKLLSLEDKQILIRYQDDEEDLITVTSTEELKEALTLPAIVKFHVTLATRPSQEQPNQCPRWRQQSGCGNQGRGCGRNRFWGRGCHPCQGNWRGGSGNQSTEGADVHPAFCDACSKQIQGIRYKCTVCDDYDHCQACQDKNSIEGFHKHAFQTIRTPLESYQLHWNKIVHFPGGILEIFLGEDEEVQPQQTQNPAEQKKEDMMESDQQQPSVPQEPKSPAQTKESKEEVKEEPFRYAAALQQLEEMGFNDRQKNIKILEKTKGDIVAAIREILDFN